MASMKCLAALCASVLLAHAAWAAPELTNADLKKQVMDTERAFAASMKNRDFAAFKTFLSSETVFFSGPTPLHGSEAVAKFWEKFYAKPEAPFAWEPDEAEVLASGTLAITGGPVTDVASGKVFARFSSIWRQEAPGKWRIIFDRGWSVSEPKPEPKKQ
jgi:ketosteroid isomerase-like protein